MPHNIIYNTTTYTILLPVDAAQVRIPGKISDYAAKTGLTIKPEYHITLIPSATAKLLKQRCKTRHTHWRNLTQFCDNMSWNFELLDTFYALEKTYEDNEVRRSVIQAAHLPSIATLTEFLRENMGIPLPHPFPHLTLFSTSTNESKKSRGISVYSKEDLETIATHIE